MMKRAVLTTTLTVGDQISLGSRVQLFIHLVCLTTLADNEARSYNKVLRALEKTLSDSAHIASIERMSIAMRDRLG